MMDGLKKEILEARSNFVEEIKNIRSLEHLQEVRESYFGRKRGIVTSFYSRLKELAPELKPSAGKWIHELRDFVESGLKEAEENCKHLLSRWVDFTLPPTEVPVGHFHPLSFVRREIESLFVQMGYEVAAGPEMESEANNFDALNVPAEHPARDEHDTFFLAGWEGMILRTHTSPVQIRYMKNHRPPIQIIAPGKVFRKDNPDATHSPVFHQIEGLLVDKGIHFSHLKGTLEYFVKSYFGETIRMRFRPTYFPFTEPSADIYISCFLCEGKNSECPVCKGRGWIEILGSGMVHPNVLRNCGIDPRVYSGFAFGMGIERMAIIKYGIPDLRMLYDNDLRLIEQLG